MTRYMHRLRDELVSLMIDVARRWRIGRRPWLAMLTCLATVGVASTLRDPRSHAVLANIGDVYAQLPLPTELLRLPASVFFPTFDLPLWAAVVQLAAVVGTAEILFGRLITTTIAAIGQFASTLSVRVMITFGAVTVFGLPFSQARVLDTGPSGITTAIGAWLLTRRHAYATLTLLAACMTVAAIVQRNIDGREHEAATFVGIAAAALQSQPVARMLRRLGSARRCSGRLVLSRLSNL